MKTLIPQPQQTREDLTNHWRALALLSIALVLLPNIFKFVNRHVHGLTENRRLAARPQFPNTFSELTSYPGRLDQYIRDNFPLRTNLIVCSNTLRYVFGYSGSNAVIVGRHGWLFYDDGSHLKFWRGLRLSDADMAAWMQDFRTRITSLNQRGIRLYLLFPPYKETIYPEKLPFWLRVHSKTGLDQLIEKLKAAALDDHLIDVRKQLLAAKDPSCLLYYKFDTHWNSLGAYIAYRELMTRIHKDFPDLNALPIKSFPQREQNEDGDLAFMLGIGNRVSTSIQRGYYFYIEPKTDWLTTRRDVLAPRIIHTGIHNGRTLMLTKDSYSNALLPFLAHNFERIAVSYVEEGFFREDLIEKVHPDIVLIESVEQFCGIAF